MSLLQVKNLNVQLKSKEGIVNVINDISFSVNSGEIVALVGESGSGKSITAMSVIDLLPKRNVHSISGEIHFEQRDLLQLSEKEKVQIRGKDMSIIFQNPLSALDPSFKIGNQLVESIRHTQKVTKQQAKVFAFEWLEKVGIKDGERVYQSYPHEISGGMRQRVVIAMAISSYPKLIIADEPTTALDATIQKQVLQLLKDINKELKSSIIIITHDFGVVAHVSDRVAIMNAGKIVEIGQTKEILTNPQHPYTKGLIEAVPRLRQPSQQEVSV